MLKLGVIGYGYWGTNLVQNFQETLDATVVMVADLKPENLANVQKRYPTNQTITQGLDVFNNPSINAVAIATPVFTHYDLCLQAIRAGKNVLVEKPLAPTAEKAFHFVEEAKKSGPFGGSHFSLHRSGSQDQGTG